MKYGSRIISTLLRIPPECFKRPSLFKYICDCSPNYCVHIAYSLALLHHSWDTSYRTPVRNGGGIPKVLYLVRHRSAVSYCQPPTGRSRRTGKSALSQLNFIACCTANGDTLRRYSLGLLSGPKNRSEPSYTSGNSSMTRLNGRNSSTYTTFGALSFSPRAASLPNIWHDSFLRVGEAGETYLLKKSTTSALVTVSNSFATLMSVIKQHARYERLKTNQKPTPRTSVKYISLRMQYFRFVSADLQF